MHSNAGEYDRRVVTLDLTLKFFGWDIGNANGGHLLSLRHPSLTSRFTSIQLAVGGVSRSQVCTRSILRLYLLEQFPCPADGAKWLSAGSRDMF